MFPDPTWLVAITILSFVALPALVGLADVLARYAGAQPGMVPPAAGR
jgi:hypothetical protein